MNAFLFLGRWWKDHGTKVLGTATMIVSGLQEVAGLIPPEHKPFWAAAGVVLGALTLNRGFTNSKAQP